MQPFLALITPLSNGGGTPPERPPGVPTFPIAGYPDFPYPSQPIYLPGYPGGGRPPSFRPPSVPGVPTFPIWGPPGSNFPDKPGYPPVAGHPLPPIPGEPGMRSRFVPACGLRCGSNFQAPTARAL